MATQTAVQIQLDQMGQQYYLEPFTYRTQCTIPTAYGNVTENLLIGADADFFVTGVSATITDKRGVVQLDDAYRDQFKVNITNNNTGKRYMNSGVELSEFVDSINSVEFRGFLWKIQSQLQFTVEHTNYVQFKRLDPIDATPNSEIEFRYGRVKVTSGYLNIANNANVMNELWTFDGADSLVGASQPYISNQSPYMPVQIGLSFNGVKLFAKGA